MSGFGWSTGDVVLAGKLIAKLVKSLREADGARDDYQQSIHFLTGLETTLTNLAAVGNILPQNTAAQEILTQTENTYSGGFITFAGRCQKARAVETLESKISIPLATVNTNIGIQILDLIQNIKTNLPTSVCDMLSARISSTFPIHLARETEPICHAINTQASASRQIMQTLSTNHALQLNAQQDLRNSLTENMAIFHANMQVLQASIESNSLFLTQIKDAAFTSTDRSIITQQAPSPRKRVTESLQTLSRALRELLLAFLELIWPFMLLFLRRLQGVRTCMSRLLVGDSIIFEDALGRVRYLPFEFFQHWEVFLPYLHKSFEQVPGLYNISRRRYHLLNSRSGNIIDPKLWSASVRTGSCLTMAMVVFKVSTNERGCPHCGQKQVPAQGNLFVNCSMCDFSFRSFEPGKYRSITPSDGRRGSSVYALRSANRRLNVPEWPTLTFPDTKITSPRIEEVPENVAPVQKLRIFKRVDVLFVNDPGKTVAILEELIDLAHTHEDFREFLSHETEVRLRRFVRLVRFELEQEINFFDFKLWNMNACEKTISALQGWLNGDSRPIDVWNWNWPDRAFLDFVPSLRRKLFDDDAVSTRTMVVLVKGMTGIVVTLRMESHTTVEDLKDMLSDRGGVAKYHQCLIYNGRKLIDGRCMEDYGISTEFYIYVVLTHRDTRYRYTGDPGQSWLLYDRKERPFGYLRNWQTDSGFTNTQLLLYEDNYDG